MVKQQIVYYAHERLKVKRVTQLNIRHSLAVSPMCSYSCFLKYRISTNNQASPTYYEFDSDLTRALCYTCMYIFIHTYIQTYGVYFMPTVCGRPQGGGGPAHVDACGQGEGVKNLIFLWTS